EKFRKSAMGPAGWMNANLRTTFTKIIKRAGLSPWPKPFQNLRASRETELVEKHPVHVVTGWLGNTPRVAMQHYLMITDEHFDAAVQGDEPDVEAAPRELVDEAAQKAAQHTFATNRELSHAQQSAHEKPRTLPGFASSCEIVQLPGMAGTGFEPATSR